MSNKYWLIKSEPETFSLDDFQRKKDQTEPWDGVRNYQARNYMRDEMKVGDQVLFYYSNCSKPGVVGVVEVVRESYADPSQWDEKSEYYDPKATRENPRWFMVDMKFVSRLPRIVSLQEMKGKKELQGMKLVQRGNRLSVMPVTHEEYKVVLKMAKEEYPET